MARNFPLSGLLRLRELQENKAAGELASANKALRGGQSAVKNMQDSVGAGEDNPVNGATLLAVAASRASTSSMLLELNAVVSVLDGRAQSARQEHQRARTEVKALEKLAERHTAEVRLEDLGREQALLDDLGSTATRGRNA